MKDFRKKLILLVIAALCVSTVIAIIIVLIGNYSATEWRILVTTAVVFAYCICIFIAISKYQDHRKSEHEKKEPKDNRILVYVISGILYSTFAAIILALTIWDVFTYPRSSYAAMFIIVILRLLLTLALTAAAAALIAFLLPHKNQEKAILVVKWSTIAITLLCTAMTTVAIWLWDTDSSASASNSPFVARAYLITLILVVFGTILTPIVGLLYKEKPVTDEPPIDNKTENTKD